MAHGLLSKCIISQGIGIVCLNVMFFHCCCWFPDSGFSPNSLLWGLLLKKKRCAQACARLLSWAWLGRGLGVAWAWRGRGVGVAWAWRGRGVGVAWAWRGRGLGVAWAWLGRGVGVA